MLNSFRRALADFFFPPLCLVCRQPVASYAETFLCGNCAADLTFINSPLCRICGIMFKSREGDDHVCGSCLSAPPRFDRARSVGVYAGTLRAAIHAFKYRGGLLFAKPLGRLLAEHGRQVLEAGPMDFIAPVPLHSKRLRERGFNQSLELARCVGKSWDIAVAAEGLQRIRQTPQQAALPRTERSRNVRGAFAWEGCRLGGKRVLLIDDVYTSGATADECAGILKKAGAAAVAVLTLAHTQ
jgi:ComF family protein